MHVAEEILNRVRRMLGFGKPPLRFDVSEEEILADLTYGRDDDEAPETDALKIDRGLAAPN